jgi:hypothetical protein
MQVSRMAVGSNVIGSVGGPLRSFHMTCCLCSKRSITAATFEGYKERALTLGFDFLFERREGILTTSSGPIIATTRGSLRLSTQLHPVNVMPLSTPAR